MWEPLQSPREGPTRCSLGRTFLYNFQRSSACVQSRPWCLPFKPEQFAVILCTDKLSTEALVEKWLQEDFYHCWGSNTWVHSLRSYCQVNTTCGAGPLRDKGGAVEEKPGLRCTEPEAGLGKILVIIRCKIVSRGFSFYQGPIKTEVLIYQKYMPRCAAEVRAHHASICSHLDHITSPGDI